MDGAVPRPPSTAAPESAFSPATSDANLQNSTQFLQISSYGRDWSWHRQSSGARLTLDVLGNASIRNALLELPELPSDRPARHGRQPVRQFVHRRGSPLRKLSLVRRLTAGGWTNWFGSRRRCASLSTGYGTVCAGGYASQCVKRWLAVPRIQIEIAPELLVEDAEAGPDAGLAIAERVPGEAQAGSEIQVRRIHKKPPAIRHQLFTAKSETTPVFTSTRTTR